MKLDAPIETTVATLNVAALMSPRNTAKSAYWVKGRLFADRAPDLAARAHRAGADVLAATEVGPTGNVGHLTAALGPSWAAVHDGESDNLRLALFYDGDVWEKVSHRLGKTAGPNHNRALIVELRHRATGLVRTFAVVHFYHRSGHTYDVLRGRQAGVVKADVIAGDWNSALGDKGDRTTAAARANGLLDAELIAAKRIGGRINTAPGGKTPWRQIDRIALRNGSAVHEWGVLADNDKTPDTDHGGLVYATATLRRVA